MSHPGVLEQKGYGERVVRLNCVEPDGLPEGPRPPQGSHGVPAVPPEDGIGGITVFRGRRPGDNAAALKKVCLLKRPEGLTPGEAGEAPGQKQHQRAQQQEANVPQDALFPQGGGGQVSHGLSPLSAEW